MGVWVGVYVYMYVFLYWYIYLCICVCLFVLCVGVEGGKGQGTANKPTHHPLHSQQNIKHRLDVIGDPTPTPCPREIEACEWIPLDELTSQPRFRASPLYSCVYDLCRAHAFEDRVDVEGGEGLEGIVSLTPIWGTRLPMGFRPGSALLYHTSGRHHKELHQGEEEEGEGGEKGDGGGDR